MASKETVKCRVWQENYQRVEVLADKLGWHTPHGKNQILNLMLKIAEDAINSGAVDLNALLLGGSPQVKAVERTNSPVRASKPVAVPSPPRELDEDDDEEEVFINPLYNPSSSLWEKKAG